MTKDNLEQLAYVQLTDKQLSALDKFTSLKSYRQGEKLFSAGDNDFKFFVIKKGQVEIVERSTGKQKTVTVHEEKEFTGDISMLTGRPSPVSAVAATDCEVYEVSNADLKRILKEIPQLGDCILQAFLTRRQLLESSEYTGLKVIGSKYARDTLRLRDFLAKNKIPFTWIDLESDRTVDELLKQFEITREETPIVLLDNNSVLKNPENTELAKVLGIRKPLEDIVYDLAIIGAGPGGLAAAVYGASEGLKTIVLEKTAPGGQASCSSKIENYMGFPLGLSGTDLANRALLQAQKFGAQITSPAKVVGLESYQGYKLITLASEEQVTARCVVIATGVRYKRLPVDRCEEFEDCGVYYSATAVEAELCRDRVVVIVGGGNSAGQAAIFLSQYVEKVLLLIRSDSLSHSMSAYLSDRIEQSDMIELLTHTEVTKMMGEDCLEAVEITNNQTQEKQEVKVAGVFIFVGAIPCTDWLPSNIATDEKGFIKTGMHLSNEDIPSLKRQPFLLETSQPGIFAAGDVRFDSIKRVASAVGEGSMTVKFVHQILSM
ncbi:thioredoxin reductase [Rivularia sp. PCC 7116]|uniref:FAD-dependent oxidoreductase n=1 Tax=Rivularia sp. PCC 7116 TaxID=373994 RepID=UPI00029EDB81|nr:cyclic nucleotide-binding domain-containing thioredoxin-disulfide reductase [Rivularia sp. PCC 7116]AFY55426.1 thioredoxin reductase [Rivularia sp. PCC 7116]